MRRERGQKTSEGQFGSTRYRDVATTTHTEYTALPADDSTKDWFVAHSCGELSPARSIRSTGTTRKVGLARSSYQIDHAPARIQRSPVICRLGIE